MPLETRECLDCGRKYEILSKRNGSVGMEQDALNCPDCHSMSFRWLLQAGQGIQLGDVGGVGKIYPYFDRTLNCMVNSAAHRRKIIERHKRNGRIYEPDAGDSPMREHLAKEAREEKENIRECQEYDRMLAWGEEFKEWRQQIARGNPADFPAGQNPVKYLDDLREKTR